MIPFRAATITSFREEADFVTAAESLQFIAYGIETCPSTNRVHLQAFAYSEKARKLTGWKKLFPGDHIEQMHGNFAQNEKYCSKEGQYKTIGVKPMGDGKKRSLSTLADEVVAAAETKVPLYDVVTAEPARGSFIQYHGGVQKLYDMAVTKRLKATPRDFAPEVIYVWGPSGFGKTRYVTELEPDLYRCNPSDKYKWKDGYYGQDAVLYDNVVPDNISPFDFLQEIDRYPIDVPKKGGFIAWRPRRIYITSTHSPEALGVCFTSPRELLRRITRTHYINTPVE